MPNSSDYLAAEAFGAHKERKRIMEILKNFAETYSLIGYKADAKLINELIERIERTAVEQA